MARTIQQQYDAVDTACQELEEDLAQEWGEHERNQKNIELKELYKERRQLKKEIDRGNGSSFLARLTRMS